MPEKPQVDKRSSEYTSGDWVETIAGNLVNTKTNEIATSGGKPLEVDERGNLK